MKKTECIMLQYLYLDQGDYIAKAAEPQVPNGGKIVGAYHTNWDYSIVKNPNTKKEKIIRTSYKSMDDFNSDKFSFSDEQFAAGAGRANNVDYRSYFRYT